MKNYYKIIHTFETWFYRDDSQFVGFFFKLVLLSDRNYGLELDVTKFLFHLPMQIFMACFNYILPVKKMCVAFQ